MSISAKLKFKDDDTGARIVKTRISSSTSFLTPSRMITSTEHNYKADVADLIVSQLGMGQGPSTAFENEIFQISKQFDFNKLARYLKHNGTFNNSRKDIVAKKNAYEDKFLLFYPKFTKKMLYDEGRFIGMENLKTIIDLQTESGLENVTIPESNPNQNFELFKDDLKSLSTRAFSRGAQQIIPYLDMGMGDQNNSDLFARKYEYLIDCGYPIIGMVFRGINQNYPNYRFLEERDDDVLRVCSGVGRFWRSNWTTSQLHIPNLWGLDACSLDSQTVPVSLEPKEIDDIKRFDKESIGILKLKDHQERYGDNLNCDCPVCQGKTHSDFVDEYSMDINGSINADQLDKVCKLHETYASTNEFENEMRFIRQNDLRTYITSHEYLSDFYYQAKKR